MELQTSNSALINLQKRRKLAVQISGLALAAKRLKD
jgi:hypothetical protein